MSGTITQRNIQGGGYLTSNQLKFWELQETRRANKARETENTRSNLARESTNLREHMENRRHNVAQEGEAHRSNVAREGETHRANVQNELLTASRNAETSRSNRAQEALKGESNRISSSQVDASRYAADQRYNATVYTAKTNKNIAQANLQETHRANKEKELIGYLGEANKLLSTIEKVGSNVIGGRNERTVKTRELIRGATNPKNNKGYW